MDEAPPAPYQAESLSEWTSWESWVNSFFVWVPYATLAASLVLAQVADYTTSDRVVVVALTIVAAAWTWLTFTRLGPPTRVPQSGCDGTSTAAGGTWRPRPRLGP